MTKNYNNLTPLRTDGFPRSARESIREGMALAWNWPVTQGLHIVRLLYLWQTRIDARHDLMQLKDTTLKDIGLSRKQVVEEATKPFWQE